MHRNIVYRKSPNARPSDFRKATRGPVVRRYIEHNPEPKSLTEVGTGYTARWMIHKARS
jgi:hypothetical protein